MPKLKTVFAGSPEFAATILARLADTKFKPIAVLTQPDRPKGRGRKVVANPVKTLATSLDLDVLQPKSLKDTDAQAELAALKADVFIVAAYGLILPKKVLALPKFGCINVHASLLPRWRGAAPIERAIMAGDQETGVCIMAMEAGLDTGPVFRRARVAITTETTALALESSLATVGADELIAVLKDIAAAKADKQPFPAVVEQNDDAATYADKLTAQDRQINWQLPAENIARQITALSSRLPVRVELNNCGVQLLAARVIEQALHGNDTVAPGMIVDASKNGITVQCATDLLQITSLKVERGKGKVLDPAAALNGYKDLFHPGARFST